MKGRYVMDEKCKSSFNEEEFPPIMNAEQIAGYLGISQAKAYTLLRSNGFPSISLGRRIIVPRDRFFEWINTQLEEKLKADSEKAAEEAKYRRYYQKRK